MPETGSGAQESKRIAFLAMFFARAHRTLYRAQFVGELGEAMGFSTAEARECAQTLRDRGLLRLVSALPARGPLMEITPAGISAAQRSITGGTRPRA